MGRSRVMERRLARRREMRERGTEGASGRGRRWRMKTPVCPSIGPEMMRTWAPEAMGAVEMVALKSLRELQRVMKSVIWRSGTVR